MRKILIALSVVLAMVFFVPGQSFARFIWANPGESPFTPANTQGIETHIRQMSSLPKEVQDDLIRQVQDALVAKAALKQLIDAEPSLTTEEKSTAWEQYANAPAPFFNVEELEKRSLPQPVLKKARALVKIPTVAFLKPGQEFDYMASGKDRIVRDVVYTPAPGMQASVPAIHRQGSELKAYIFEASKDGMGYVIVMPTICNNLAMYRHQLNLAQPAPTPRATPDGTPTATLQPLGPEWKIFHIREWRPGPTANKLVGHDGYQSRDLGFELTEHHSRGAKTEALAEHLACGYFTFKIFGVRATAIGQPFVQNGKIQDTIGQKYVVRHYDDNLVDLAIETPVCQGEGDIAFKRIEDPSAAWVLPHSVVYVEGAKERHYQYPRTQALKTCSGLGNDWKICGRNVVAEIGEFAQEFADLTVTRFNFRIGQ
ncbi:MAG: hypothetical protein HY220_04255 [Candidatus Sungbacteria bacterium]|uniref:Uncharacterized protein n=1 Tax=Candidatus Sungiibacteriota bacterium TaxID=2750080 RepID=A0A9D6QU93_9BACT|nr:hypothetical protein [Candidatus Sungbacteria bacterium]